MVHHNIVLHFLIIVEDYDTILGEDVSDCYDVLGDVLKARVHLYPIILLTGESVTTSRFTS
jgi:hypothetical protein